jgi:hypothetical protein
LRSSLLCRTFTQILPRSLSYIDMPFSEDQLFELAFKELEGLTSMKYYFKHVEDELSPP